MAVVIGTDFMQFHECGISSVAVYVFQELMACPKKIDVPVLLDNIPKRH